jgi:hypothetical protein
VTTQSGSRNGGAGSSHGADEAGVDEAGDRDDDLELRSIRAVWRSMRQEDPPGGGLAELLAAARAKAETMQPRPRLWQRLVAALRRPPALAFVTVMVVVGGAVLFGRRHAEHREVTREVARAASPGAFEAPAAARGPEGTAASHGPAALGQVEGTTGSMIAVPHGSEAGDKDLAPEPPSASGPPPTESAMAQDRALKLQRREVASGTSRAAAGLDLDATRRPGARAPATARIAGPSDAARVAGDDAARVAGDDAARVAGGDAARVAGGDAATLESAAPRANAAGTVMPTQVAKGASSENAGPRANAAGTVMPTQVAKGASSENAGPRAGAPERDKAGPRANVQVQGNAGPRANVPGAATSGNGPRGSLGPLYRQCESAARQGDCVGVKRIVERITTTDRSYRARLAKDSPIAKCLAD